MYFLTTDVWDMVLGTLSSRLWENSISSAGTPNKFSMDWQLSIVDLSIEKGWEQGFLSIVVPRTFPSISILERYFLGSLCLQTWLSQTFFCMPRKEWIALLRATNPVWNSWDSNLNVYEEYLWNSSIFFFPLSSLDKTFMLQISGYLVPLLSPVLSEGRFWRTKGRTD